MVTHQYFSAHVFHIAENYLEAAERCLEGRPEEGSEAVNALLWPSEHCAIIACELFLKSLIAQTEKPKSGVIYTPTYEAKVYREKDDEVIIESLHIGKKLINYIKATNTGLLVWNALDSHEKCFLLKNTHRFPGTRYPFERDDIRPDQTHLKIARRLRTIIREVIKPNENGDISLERTIIDPDHKKNNEQAPINEK